MKLTKLKTVLGYLGFFFLIAATVTVAIFICEYLSFLEAHILALVMFGVIVFLAALCTIIDILRRKFSVSKPVNQILIATQKIAAGDFSVRLDQRHSANHFDEFDHIAENLNVMAAELSKNEMLKTDFIANVSHEIKTPLAVIQNYATALQDESLTAQDRKQYTQTIIQASVRLNNLVMNVLKLNKLDNQELSIEMLPVRLDEMLAQTVFAFEDVIEQKNLQLKCDFDEITIRSSAPHLDIIWSNLLSNAIKFTPEGGTIAIYLKKHQDKAIVTVSDNGCGMTAETGKHIFDKFYQGDTSRAKDGNGLGLALVKKVIDVLGGEISVESELGKGSTFTVTLKGICHEKI